MHERSKEMSSKSDFVSPNLQCICHNSSVTDTTIKPFNESTWRMLLFSVEIWRDLVGNTAEIAKRFVEDHGVEGCIHDISMPKDAGRHQKCYDYLTDKSKQKRGLTAKEKQQAKEKADLTAADARKTQESPAIETTVSSEKKIALRSASGLCTTATARPHVLPRICIICRTTQYVRDRSRKSRPERLTSCELVDGGQLLEAAKLKQDQSLLIQIENRDCVAIEVKYHASCHKQYTNFLTRSKPAGEKEQLYAKAFDQFCTYAIDGKIIRDKSIIRISKLKKLFDKAVRDIERADSSNYKTWSLKQRLLKRYPQLHFLKPRKKYESEFVYVDQLCTEDLVEGATQSDTDTDTDTDVDTTDSESASEHITTRTGTTARNRAQPIKSPSISTLRDRYTSALDLREVIQQISPKALPWPSTSSDLTLDTAQNIIPPKLFNFVAWVVGASDDPTEDSYVDVKKVESRRILNISQDIVYLASKGKKMMPKHSSLAMAVRHLSGSAQLIGLLNGFGYSASHSYVLEHDTALAEQEMRRGPKSLPSCLQLGIFTTLIWDNNDFGEETLSGKGTTHNTNGIAVQHKQLQPATRAEPSSSGPIKKTKRRSLPAPEKDLVHFGGLKKSSPNAFGTDVLLDLAQSTTATKQTKYKDDAYYITKVSGDRLLPSWTGFNQLLTTEVPPKATIGYLPVIDASPTDMHTVNTILHRSVEIADILELPSIVVVVDQAIYAKAQNIRWQTPLYMNRIVIRLGAFHTTMAALACIGKRFGDAGLQDILIEAEVVASGSVNGVLNGHHYNRSMRCHKLFSEALHRLRWQSFIETVSEEKAASYQDIMKKLHTSFPTDAYNEVSEGPEFKTMMVDYDDFIKSQSDRNSTFAFWSSYLDFVESILLFTRATRDGDWDLHLAAIRSLLPWMFAYDRTNYARYLPIYWLEMKALESTHPFIYNEQKEGNFAVQRQDVHGFARVACDMTIEQTANRDSKTRGGMKGFTTRKGACNRWISAHHERAAITRQCEEMAGKGQKVSTRKDLTKGRMTRDAEDVGNIVNTICTMINPFDQDPEVDQDDLVHLSSGVIAPPDVCTDMKTAYQKGDVAFLAFCKDRLQGNEIDLNQPLKKMKLKTFTDVGKKVSTKAKGKEVGLKSDRELLARLVIISRARNIDVKNMMTYCLGPLPLGISTPDGCLVKTNKARLLHYLESAPETTPKVDIPPGSVWIVDGMALLQQMSPKYMPDRMGQLADKILGQLVNLARSHSSTAVHFVTDRYPPVSIKNAERKRRAASGSQKIKIKNPDQPVPKQWKKYLSHSFNKEQLVKFLFEMWSKCDIGMLKGVTVTVAHGDVCHAIVPQDGMVCIQDIEALHCSHEEADTRMFLHANYIAQSGSSSIIIKSPDTDVFVIGIALTPCFPNSQLYFHTGKDENQRTLHLHAIAQHLGSDITRSLVGLHCFTGCDSVSSFYGKGKMKAVKLLMENPTLCSAFQSLGETFTVTEDMLSDLEVFVCKLYGQKDKNVNDARYAMFSMATRAENVMPPNRDALHKHIERANFQAAIYKRSLQQHPDVPPPAGNGWKLVDGELAIDWMQMESAQASIEELFTCTCKKSRCKNGVAGDKCCSSLGLPCTELCTCRSCDNRDRQMPIDDVEDLDDEPEDIDEGDDGVDDEDDFEEETFFR